MVPHQVAWPAIQREPLPYAITRLSQRSSAQECTWELGRDVECVAATRVREFEARESCGVATIVDEWRNATMGDDATVGRPLDVQPPWLVGGALHGYQLEGINWLRSKWLASMNVILADEMGLGKTIMSTGYLGSVAIEHFGSFDKGQRDDSKATSAGESSANAAAALIATSEFRPSLVVAPLSTLENWEREMTKWCPLLNVVVLSGNQAARNVIRCRELHTQKSTSRQQVLKFHCIITSFEIACLESSLLRRFKWSALVVDEGHRLKSGESSKLFQELMQLDCAHRVILTGTPLQNSLQELYHLIKFLDLAAYEALTPSTALPTAAPVMPQDGATINGVMQGCNEDLLRRLRAMLDGRMLRRIKADVLQKTLVPAKRELVVHVELTASQKLLYKAVLTRNYATLASCDRSDTADAPSSATANSVSSDANGASTTTRQVRRRRLLDVTTGLSASSSTPRLQNIVVQLRKVCNHTSLLAPQLGYTVRGDLTNDASQTPLEQLLEGSGKLALLDKMLVKWNASGNRVLIFSQMTTMLDVIADYLSIRSYAFERLDGSTSARDRQVRIDRFNAPDSSSFVFLLSTRAGGLGINLATADTVVIYDVDWNPHNDLQALARAHRIGQTQKVAIYRLVSRASVEERMIEVAKRKLCLEHVVVARGGAKGANAITRQEVNDVLRYGAEALFKSSDRESDKVITWDDKALDALLDRDDADINAAHADLSERVDGENNILRSSALSALMDSFKVANISFATKIDDANEVAAVTAPESDNARRPAPLERSDDAIVVDSSDNQVDVDIDTKGGRTAAEVRPEPERGPENLDSAASDAGHSEQAFRWSDLLRPSYEEMCTLNFESFGKGKRERRSVVQQVQLAPGAPTASDSLLDEDDSGEAEVPSRSRRRSPALQHLANRVLTHGLVGAYGGRWDWTHQTLRALDAPDETRERSCELLERCLENDAEAIGHDPDRVLARFAFFVLIEKCLERSIAPDALAIGNGASGGETATRWEYSGTGFWTGHHDRRLLAAICCHGHGRWERILAGDRFGLGKAIDAELDARPRRRATKQRLPPAQIRPGASHDVVHCTNADVSVDAPPNGDEEPIITKHAVEGAEAYERRKIEGPGFLRDRVRAMEKALVYSEMAKRSVGDMTTSHERDAASISQNLKHSIEAWRAHLSQLLRTVFDEMGDVQSIRSRLAEAGVHSAEAEAESAAFAAHHARLAMATRDFAHATRAADETLGLLHDGASMLSNFHAADRWRWHADTVGVISTFLDRCRTLIATADENVAHVDSCNRQVSELLENDIMAEYIHADSEHEISDAVLEEYSRRWGLREWRVGDDLIRRRTSAIDECRRRYAPFARLLCPDDCIPAVPFDLASVSPETPRATNEYPPSHVPTSDLSQARDNFDTSISPGQHNGTRSRFDSGRSFDVGPGRPQVGSRDTSSQYFERQYWVPPPVFSATDDPKLTASVPSPRVVSKKSGSHDVVTASSSYTHYMQVASPAVSSRHEGIRNRYRLNIEPSAATPVEHEYQHSQVNNVMPARSATCHSGDGEDTVLRTDTPTREVNGMDAADSLDSRSRTPCAAPESGLEHINCDRASESAHDKQNSSAMACDDLTKLRRKPRLSFHAFTAGSEARSHFKLPPPPAADTPNVIDLTED